MIEKIQTAYPLSRSLTAVIDKAGNMAVFNDRCRVAEKRGNEVSLDLSANHNAQQAALAGVLPDVELNLQLMRMRLKRGKDYRVGEFLIKAA